MSSRLPPAPDQGRVWVSPEDPPAGTISAAAQEAVSSFCIECVRIRVGLPRVVRGPSPGIPDNPFTEIRLPSGQFRGFSASASTYAIDGASPWAMSGTPVPVLRPGAPGTYDSCGQWLNHVERSGIILVGWVHDETACNYGHNSQTHKSMSLVTPKDEGLTWEELGQIITGVDAPTPGK